MGKRNNIIMMLLGVLIIGYFAFRYIYHDHRDIASEKPEITVLASELFSLFTENDPSKILNKTVEVTGFITETDSTSVILDNKVHCVFLNKPSGLSTNQKISVKGRCIGYDDLFEVVKLDQCVVIK
jgi:hypothetical protein